MSASGGLTQAEAERRLRERGPPHKQASSRSYRSIAIANTFTVFNLILAVFGAATIVFGNPKDALFLGILVANIAIGTFQEVRAKRALDKLAALVVAEGDRGPRRRAAARCRSSEVVVGDLVRVASGDQIAADGTLVRADGLALDESDADRRVRAGPARRRRRGPLRLLRGRGRGRLRGDRGRRRQPRRPADRDRARLPPPALAAGEGDGPAADHPRRGDGCRSAIALGVSLAIRDVSQADAVETLTAAIVNIVPEGLILLVSLTAAVSAAKMARHGILAQQLNAIESLASVSVMCTDKTGTLTEASLRVVELVPADGVERGRAGARRFGALRGQRADAATRPWRRSTPPGSATTAPAAASRRRRSPSPRGGAGARSSSTASGWCSGAPEALLDGADAADAALREPRRAPRRPPAAACSPSRPRGRRCPRPAPDGDR